MKAEHLRQGVVISGLFICSISEGFIFGQMSGMLAAMPTEKDVNLTEDEISWIASAINATAMIGFALAGAITDILGRPLAISVLTLPLVANWILLYFARNFITFLLSRIIVGVCYGGVLLLVFVGASEYTAPNARGFCLNIITSVGPSLGTAIGHILSTVLHWRTVALLGIIPSVISAILPWLWVESPSWLASKGKFEECRKAFISLHGHRGKEAEKELQLLIELEQFKKDKNSKSTEKSPALLKNIRNAVKQRYFWKLQLLLVFANLYRSAGGKIQYSILAIGMLKDITGESDIVLQTILVDLFYVTGSVLSCFLILRMKMLTLFFSTAIMGNVILLTLSICIYFQTVNNTYFPWINSVSLALYFISITSGPYPVLDALSVELQPVEIKSFSIFLISLSGGIFVMSSMKLVGPMCLAVGYHGMFVINIALMTISIIYFWFYLPETKGRTLQEIELYVKTGSFDIKEQLLNKEEIKGLV